VLHEYHVIHSAWYYLWFHVTTVGFECVTHGCGGPPVIVTADLNYVVSAFFFIIEHLPSLPLTVIVICQKVYSSSVLFTLKAVKCSKF